MASSSRMRRSSVRILRRRLASSAPERLVEEHEPRPDHQRARKRHALLLTAGDLVYASVLETLEADEVQHVERARASFAVADRLGSVAQAEGDIIEDGKMREQGEVLEHETDATQIRRPVGYVLVLQEHASPLQRLEACDRAKEDSFARAARSKQGNILSRIDREGDDSRAPARPPKSLVKPSSLRTGTSATASCSIQVEDRTHAAGQRLLLRSVSTEIDESKNA